MRNTVSSLSNVQVVLHPFPEVVVAPFVANIMHKNDALILSSVEHVPGLWVAD